MATGGCEQNKIRKGTTEEVKVGKQTIGAIEKKRKKKEIGRQERGC
jgi:hypothetical protein